jgi:AraC family transcriptional regulator, transcriptional activator of pobA
MEIVGKSEEYLLLSSINNCDSELINKNNESSLSAYWNRYQHTTIIIDGIKQILQPNQILFLTEFHNVDIYEIEELNILKFNRNFYCIANHDSTIGCKGLLFFGSNQLPIITLDETNIKKFEILWGVFLTEMEYVDELQIEMLQMLLKRFLILSTRIFKSQNQFSDVQESKIDVIRNFNFLVEMHYKTKHSVVEYAELMHKPAKSLTNLFAIHLNKSPLKIIQDRILIEAKRYLNNSDRSIKETAFELGFEDLQSFSRFFKNKQGVSPKMFRENKIEVV